MVERIKPRIEQERDKAEALVAELERELRIDKFGLDDALEQHSDLFYRVSKALTLENSRRDALKQEIAELEAEADETVRAEAERFKEKLTETECKMRARLLPKVKGANQDLLRANRRCGELAALKEAFTQRSYAIKELVSLYVAAYFGDHSASGKNSAASSSIKDRDAAIARRGMSDARRRRERES